MEEHIENINFNDEDLLKNLKLKPLIYEITLLNFIQMYDITGKRTMFKNIINHGEGIDKPIEDNEVKIAFKLRIDNILIKENENLKTVLNLDNFNEAEIIILKSMKEKENCIVDVDYNYIFPLIKEVGILNEEVKNLHLNLKKKRIVFEFELKKFKNSISSIVKDEVTYLKTVIQEGIGNSCPWENSLVMLALEIKANGVILTSDFTEKFQFFKSIKQLKKEILLKHNYFHDLQFLIEDYQKQNILKEYSIFELYLHQLPDIVNEIVPKMKILEINSIKFKGTLDYFYSTKNKFELIPEDNYEEKDYEILICLINFQENSTILNKSVYSKEAINFNVANYKKQANYFYSKGLLKRAFKINKYLTDEFIKVINLTDKKLLTHNQETFTQTAKLEQTSEIAQELKEELLKVFSNLILILFKLKQYKLALDYIKQFHIIESRKNEKVLCFEYNINKELGNLKEAKDILLTLIDFTSKEEYKTNLTLILKQIEFNSKTKNKFVKKCFEALQN